MKRNSFLVAILGIFCAAFAGLSPVRAHDPADEVPPWGAPDSVTFPSGVTRISAQIKTTGSGNWSNASTWVTTTGTPTNGAPNNTSVVRIEPNHTVVVDGVSNGSSTYVADIIYVSSGATLRFDPSKNTKLVARTIYVAEGGILEMGTTSTPIGSSYTAELSLGGSILSATTDPYKHSSGLVVVGKLITCGQKKTPFSHCTSGSVSSGNTTIALSEDPDYADSPVYGWQSGDTVAFPDTRSIYARRFATYGSHSGASFSANPDPASWSETKTLSSTSSNTATHTYSLSLGSGLSWNHLGNTQTNTQFTTTMTPWVMNLTRNVRIRSTYPSDPDKRAHVIVQHTGTADVRYTEFDDLGRTTTAALSTAANPTSNQIGRYSLHFHHMSGPTTSPIPVGDRVYRSVAIGCAFNGSPKWLVAVHDSTRILIQDNSLYDARGSAFVTESGSECWNDIIHNFAAKCSGGLLPEDKLDTGNNVHPGTRAGSLGNPKDFGSEGVGFWLSSASNTIRKNIAADCAYSGILVFPHFVAGQQFPLTPDASEMDHAWSYFQMPSIYPIYLVNNAAPIQHNTAYACGRGFEIWGESPYTVYDSTAWNCHIGVACRNCHKLTVSNATVIGDGQYNPAYNPGTYDPATPNANVTSFSEGNQEAFLYGRPTIGADSHWHVIVAQVYGLTAANTGIGMLTATPTGVSVADAYRKQGEQITSTTTSDGHRDATGKPDRYARDLVIQYGNFHCDAGIIVTADLHYKKTYENNRIGPGRTYLLDCHFYPRVANSTWSAIVPILSIGNDKNVIAGDEIWVGNYQGESNWNYRVYYNLQAPDVIVPHSSPYRGNIRWHSNDYELDKYSTAYGGMLLSRIEGLEDESNSANWFIHTDTTNLASIPQANPITGKTNAEAWSLYGKAIAGAVAPSTAGPVNNYGWIRGLADPISSLPSRQTHVYHLEAGASLQNTPGQPGRYQIEVVGYYRHFWDKPLKVDIYNGSSKLNGNTPLTVDGYESNYGRLTRLVYVLPENTPLNNLSVKVANGEPAAGTVIGP